MHREKDTKHFLPTADQCPSGTKEELLTRNRWAIPLCSYEKNPHWVLAYVDFQRAEFGLYDSKPELGSSYWALKVRSTGQGNIIERVLILKIKRIFVLSSAKS
jgi:hypothetical protein